jgi:hypothetical protein
MNRHIFIRLRPLSQHTLPITGIDPAVKLEPHFIEMRHLLKTELLMQSANSLSSNSVNYSIGTLMYTIFIVTGQFL